MLCVLFFCVLLWEIERTLCKRKGAWESLVSFFSHRTHRFNGPFWCTVSNPQNASGIQISQSVKTIVDTNKGQHKVDFLLIGVSRWSLPFPPGEGSGEGPAVDVVVASCGQCCGQLGMVLWPLSYSGISVVFPPILFFLSPLYSLSIFLLLSIFLCASLDLRTCLSTFENMPFLRIEGAFLVSRGASSSILYVIVWFLVSYMLISLR